MNRQSSVLRHITFLGTRIFLSWRTWAEASSRSLPKERQGQPGMNKTLSVYLPLLAQCLTLLISFLCCSTETREEGGLLLTPLLLSYTVEKERMESKRWTRAWITEWRRGEILLRLSRLRCRAEPLLTPLPPSFSPSLLPSFLSSASFTFLGFRG